jgi:hypothetical protein
MDLSGRVANLEQQLGDTQRLRQSALSCHLFSIGMRSRKLLSRAETDWIPADGRPLPASSQYGSLDPAVVNSPDLRGMFLRAFQVGRVRNDGRQDPENGRKSGSEQTHALEGHGHALQTKAVSFANVGNPNFAGNIFTEGHYNATVNEAVQPLAGAATETRPNSVAVHWYLKINVSVRRTPSLTRGRESGRCATRRVGDEGSRPRLWA